VLYTKCFLGLGKKKRTVRMHGFPCKVKMLAWAFSSASENAFLNESKLGLLGLDSLTLEGEALVVAKDLY